MKTGYVRMLLNERDVGVIHAAKHYRNRIDTGMIACQ